MTDLSRWSPPPLPPRVPVQGRHARLEPLSRDHAAGLFEAQAEDAEGAMWRYLSVGPHPDAAAFAAWVEAQRILHDPLHFAVRMRDGRLGGTLSLMRIAPAAGSIELGWVTFAPRLQRTVEATEAVVLLVRWAFEAGYRRFEWKCDAANLASRRAAQRYGFSFEGVFRQAAVVKGRNRDTAWFAAIDAEWPALQAAYDAWLDPANFDAEGRQRPGAERVDAADPRGARPGLVMLGALTDLGFDVLTRNHAAAILAHDFPRETAELVDELARVRIDVAELVGGGGGESGQTQRLRHALSDRNWRKHSFTVETIVDGRARAGISHEVDHVRFGGNGTLALEIEWNNKDPFFDRDLENFQRLHALSAISLGIVVTRGTSLQEALLPRVTDWLEAHDLRSEEDFERLGIGARTRAQRRNVAEQVARGVPFARAFARKFVADKFGPASTHWAKLEDRVKRGVGNPCPLLLIGLPGSVLDEG